MVALSSHLCQILHVWRFDVHHIEALVGVIQMPQVDTQVITRDEGLLITADGNGIDMIRVCVSEHTPTSRLHDLLHTSDLHKGVLQIDMRNVITINRKYVIVHSCCSEQATAGMVLHLPGSSTADAACQSVVKGQMTTLGMRRFSADFSLCSVDAASF